MVSFSLLIVYWLLIRRVFRLLWLGLLYQASVIMICILLLFVNSRTEMKGTNLQEPQASWTAMIRLCMLNIKEIVKPLELTTETT